MLKHARMPDLFQPHWEKTVNKTHRNYKHLAELSYCVRQKLIDLSHKYDKKRGTEWDKYLYISARKYMDHLIQSGSLMKVFDKIPKAQLEFEEC